MADDNTNPPDVPGWKLIVLVGRVGMLALLSAGVMATGDNVAIATVTLLATMIALGLLIE